MELASNLMESPPPVASPQIGQPSTAKSTATHGRQHHPVVQYHHHASATLARDTDGHRCHALPAAACRSRCSTQLGEGVVANETEPKPIAARASTGAEEDGHAESMKLLRWTTGSVAGAPEIVAT